MNAVTGQVPKGKRFSESFVQEYPEDIYPSHNKPLAVLDNTRVFRRRKKIMMKLVVTANIQMNDDSPFYWIVS